MVRTAVNVAQAGTDGKTRWVELDQIVAAVRYLLSDDAAAVTGQVLAVTAGTSRSWTCAGGRRWSPARGRLGQAIAVAGPRRVRRRRPFPSLGSGGGRDRRRRRARRPPRGSSCGRPLTPRWLRELAPRSAELLGARLDIVVSQRR
jgi:hypothetical protein